MRSKNGATARPKLTRQLLAFSRRQTLRPQVLKVPSNIDDLTVLLKRLIGEQIMLKVEHGRGVWPVKADLVQLDQVIVNLVVNARDAMPTGGTHLACAPATSSKPEGAEPLTYTGMPPADYVLIEVEDTGTGMSAEVMEKIFEPFFSTKELGKGTGLGLSTVYGIIKQTGGFIYPESVVGKGTTFRIFLPRHVAAEGEHTAKVAAAAPVRDLTGHERILLVEDEDDVRAFSARALKATGYEVFEADSGEQALEVLDEIENRIDLMISDVVMPEMDGPALLLKVREHIPDLKVIFVSGYAEESVRQDIADDQSVEFLRQALFARPDQLQGQGSAGGGKERKATLTSWLSTSSTIRPGIRSPTGRWDPARPTARSAATSPTSPSSAPRRLPRTATTLPPICRRMRSLRSGRRSASPRLKVWRSSAAARVSRWSVSSTIRQRPTLRCVRSPMPTFRRCLSSCGSPSPAPSSSGRTRSGAISACSKTPV